MQKSDSVTELLKALAKFQGQLENVSKDKKGHGYKYATLGACIDAAKGPLAENGLSVIQLVSSDEHGNNTLETVLGHESGEYIATTCIVPIAKLAGGGANNPAQVMGASLTYIRRYQYAAIIGLAQEDDDAVSATKGQFKAANTPHIVRDIQAAAQMDNLEWIDSHKQEIRANWKALDGQTKNKLTQIAAG